MEFFEKSHSYVKTAFATFKASFGYIWATFYSNIWSHWHSVKIVAANEDTSRSTLRNLNYLHRFVKMVRNIQKKRILQHKPIWCDKHWYVSSKETYITTHTHLMWQALVRFVLLFNFQLIFTDFWRSVRPWWSIVHCKEFHRRSGS